LSIFFRVEHGTPITDESADKSDKEISTNRRNRISTNKEIITSKCSCKRTNKKSLGIRRLKYQKRKKQHSKPQHSRNIKNNSSNDSIKRAMHNNVKCVYLNGRSIVKKQKELELLIIEEDLDIIGITETWLNDNISDEELSINRYTLFRNDRNSDI